MSQNAVSSMALPLSQSQAEKLSQLSAELDPLQLAWTSGYLAAKAELPAQSRLPQTDSASVMTILYGSQTGNGRMIAQTLANLATAKGYSVNLQSMADYKPKQLTKETLVTFVVSTHGEGEAPDDAIELHQYLASKRAAKLDKLQFSVLALGDSSYEFFCQMGKDFEQRLIALGAKPILERVDCDVDYQQDVAAWQQALLTQADAILQSSGDSGSVVPFQQATNSQYDKFNPYQAEVIVSQKITGRDSDRSISHVELDLADSGISYQAGDALGVWFENSTALVDEILTGLQLDGNTDIELAGKTQTLQQLLLQHKELTQLSPKLIEQWAQASQAAPLLALIDDKPALRQFMLQHQLADLVAHYPISVTAEQLVSWLRDLTPRLYSIASSQQEVEDEVHLTVALVADEHQGELRYGGASSYLSQVTEGQNIKVYVEPNHHFRLPENPDTPVIMIGPGTGVAPFRSFMQQRSALGHGGDNWLFFGNPHFEQDFLYQTEWQQWLKQGVLTQLDLAFSRDQAEKIYVQHRLQQRAKQVWQWLERGAHLYICGDANRMAKDVEQALINIAMQQGGLDEAAAEQYWQDLRSNKRYQKDVY
ncbi:assimilatory sulfite reductase (NADPH) flavoprotein subunit [Shewanella marina]|uniref:assimilatory sulfite reductase (NADPH) flavoprotein subunit n=1 Tax=Shewanella marina TaxID=487319 RepID=UPI0004721822|nr:assimilatory sulfite reductase (NADPH) flavoprotein subunit [Shewanella marina]